MPVTTPYPDFDTEGEDIKRARAQVEVLRKAGQQPEGQMVNGIYVRPHWGSVLGSVLQNVMAGQLDKQTDQRQAALNQAMSQGATGWMGARPQAQQVELPGPQPEGVETPLTGMKEPTQQSKLEWMQQGMANPLTRALAAKYGEDVLFKEPEREEARQWKSQETELARQQTMVNLQSTLEVKREALQKEYDAKTLDREQKKVLADHLNAVNTAIANIKAGATLGAAQIAGMFSLAGKNVTADATVKAAEARAKGQLSGKPLPAAQANAWLGNNVSLQKVQDAMEALSTPEGQDAFGASGHLPDLALQRLNPKGVKIRAMISDIGSLKVHDRSGTAVSALEDRRLQPFIPNVRDKPEAIQSKLENFMREYQLIQQGIIDYAEDMGYKTPKVHQAAPIGAPPPAAAAAALPPGVTVKKVK